MSVRLIAISKPIIEEVSTAEELIAYVARVSNPKNQENTSTATKLLKYCIEHKHFSIFEMVNVVLEINTTRDIARQILRHRSFSFQEFCVEENTLITTKNGKHRIADLFRRQKTKQYSDMSNWLTRVYDERSKTFVNRRIKEVFDTGKKIVFELTLENGKKLTCTADHKILTNNGFKRLGSLSMDDDFVACNGIPVYRDKAWLQKAKTFSIENKTGLFGIANLAGVNPVTISKWLKHHDLGFTKKEVASYTKAWNDGLPTDKQPMFGRFHNEKTRSMMRKSATRGKNANFYVNGNKTLNVMKWRNKVAYFCKGFHTELLIKQDYKCPISGKTLTRKNSDVDHILPVYARPDLAFDVNNLQVLYRDAHKEKSKRESLESRYTIRYSKIASIVEIGERQTYDLEIDHVDHNYIANGIVTHNSQRYADASQFGFVMREARLQDTKNRQNSIENNNADLALAWRDYQDAVEELVREGYDWALRNGIAKEQARAILPEGMTMSRMYMNGSLRSWIHYCRLRMGPETQKEHREVATDAWAIITNEFPFLKDV